MAATSKKLENATALYMEGIRDGNAREAVTKYTGDRYTQHSTGVADGVEGFVAFFEPFIARCKDRDIRVVRAFVDGQHVFVQAYQDINKGEAKWVTADMFDTDANDKIVEHWDVIQAYHEGETAAGRTMVDGPTEVEDLDKTDANKAHVQRFFDEVLIGGSDKLADFISTEQFHQHNPAIGDGLEGLEAFTAALAKKGQTRRYTELHKLLGQGNFVATLSRVDLGGEDWCVIDLFRLSDGRIVEHWDCQEKILPEAQWGNSGKF